MNVSVNARANFSCVVSNADVVLWYVNGSSIDHLKNFVDTQGVRKINNTTSSIYYVSFVVGSAFETLLNNSEIQCVGMDFHPIVVRNTSTAAILRIQGLY